ncbi:DUF1128 domain-containing protein [Staphylococcus pasteuri]|nr:MULTISPECIES: DUF1128 domain-containing protein [Staphylococcus]MBM6507712.1 DUF1128 domain-containing protein [Staphylococcus pasteuri]MCD9067226.1 DUF1128 domain-containing protein [Staphylococcus pasteuri]MCE3022596.1 DUF1128 domain-containing protein [Staphylococcus pasteuri]MCF7600577.1 DUF1128 domain-containing protein [Staphylococcus pasteuri]MCO0862259.1 DUF1128 domain-containing protein [Staphylococcus pasteuri]
MITEIRQKLNIVNKALIDPDKFKDADQNEIKEIHQFVTSKDSFSPSEVTAIADALGELRQ